MYIPKEYEVTDFSQQLGLIKSYPLGILFNFSTQSNGFLGFMKGSSSETRPDTSMCATHLPFVFVEGPDGKHKLIAHLAAQNQHVDLLENNPQCMVVFQSTDSYVSPSWYPLKKKTQKYVPTWDFGAVHVYGKAKIIRNDKEWLLKMLNELSDQEEGKRPEGSDYEPKWKVSDAPEKYLDAMMEGIVGIEIDIGNIESKFKLHQSEVPVNVNGVLENYSKEVGGEKGSTMAEMTKMHYPKDLSK